MIENPQWSIILAGLALMFLGWYLGGFFVINYFIGAAAILVGVYNLWMVRK